MIDGPSTGVPRQVMAFRNMNLTGFVIKVPRGAGTPVVKKAFEASGVKEKWESSKWAKTLKAREARKNTSDCTLMALHFAWDTCADRLLVDRFRIQVLKKQRRSIIGAAAKKVQA